MADRAKISPNRLQSVSQSQPHDTPKRRHGHTKGRHGDKALSVAARSFSLSPKNNQPHQIMANYYATARSNYFAVKDEKAFREWTALLGLTILEPTHHDKVADGVPRFGIAPGDFDEGGWPSCRYNEITGDDDEIDVIGQLSAHLADDEVAVLMEVGNEKLRYVSGTATAVNSKGEIAHLDLDSIYELARALGPNITLAEY